MPASWRSPRTATSQASTAWWQRACGTLSRLRPQVTAAVDTQLVRRARSVGITRPEGASAGIVARVWVDAGRDGAAQDPHDAHAVPGVDAPRSVGVVAGAARNQRGPPRVHHLDGEAVTA